MMKLRPLLLAMLAVPAALQAKPAPVPTVQPVALSEKTLADMVKTLSSDEFEGRAPGTAGEDKTVAYLIERFKAAGMQPGNKGSWTQDVPTLEITATNMAGLAITGGAGGTMLFAPGKDFVAGSYREVARTAFSDAELVFVGYGINAPELGWNDYAGVDMKGKVAVILVNDPDYETASEDGPFKGRRMTYYGRWTYKFEEA
ncbi:MAG: peptidase M20, partial [Brevundimonas sp.]|nr:peptidase M20 [Brevundimonas sp.]